MLLTLAATAIVALADPPERKESPSKDELAAISNRGRELAGYESAAWHASDAVQAKGPKQGKVVRYIARRTGKGWEVAFGKLDEKQEKFLIAYEAIQSARPDRFEVKELVPPRPDTGFFLSAAKAIDTALKEFVEHFEGEPRPYNVAGLPEENGRLWVYLFPAPTKAKVWPLGGDVRYLLSGDGTKVIEKRQLHKAVIENEPPEDQEKRQVAGIHTHVLSEIPEDTDVFHVLSRKPAMPEFISTKHFRYIVKVDGSIEVQRNTPEKGQKK
jgi:hypothetical protein